MKSTLPNFKRANVMVVGDILLDRYWYGSTNRISPEAPVPIVKVNSVEERPGGAANVAVNIASLGAHSHLVGLTGIDDAAKKLNILLENMNVACDLVSLPTCPTLTKLRVLSRNQQLIRLDFEEGFKDIDPNLIYKRIRKSLNGVGALVLSDYAKGTLASVQQIIQLARAVNIPVLIDPKGTDFSRYRGATLLTPNVSEFEAVAGKYKTEEELVELGTKIITDLELSALLVTRSENGMTLLQIGKAPLHMATQAKEVYDVTGAGDTVIGVLAATLAAGNSLEEACYFANVAAGIVISKLGTSVVSFIELENAIRGQVSTGFGIMTEWELKVAVSAARKRGEKIVMTNGVFDILHAGHVSYLSNAKKLGDRLIIAINSDDSTKRLKGKTRPVNSLMQRMIVVSALESVDWVVSFEEDTPKRLIANLLPDFLVKGGDYKPDQIVGSEEVRASGGKVIFLDFDNEYSTTSIIKKIQKNN